MKKIYADSDICRWHLNQLNLEISEEIIDGCLAVFHIPYPYDPSFSDKIERAVSICSKVVILVSELHADSANFIVDHQHPRIKYFICGCVKGCNHGLWMDWFITTCNFYKEVNVLYQLTPYKIKPKYFDILLGWSKPHRDIVYNFINNNALTDKVIMTYLTNRIQPIDQQGLWEFDIPQNTFNTITKITHLGRTTSLSQILPISIYNQTAYTIVTETNFDNHYNFYTEKIVKPILAERLFIVFSGQHYLRNLRKLGFRTFDGIIDESYDNVEDSSTRFNMIFKQIEYLLTQSQEEIFIKIKSICQHNRQVMLERDFLKLFLLELKACLLSV